MKTCIYIPTIKVNGKEIESKLFKDLTKAFKNRDDAIDIWSLFQVPGFGEKYGLTKVNGEFLLSDIKEKFDFEKVLEGKLSKTEIEKSSGIVNEDGKSIVFSGFKDAVNKAVEFNKKHTFNNAIVVTTKGGFTIDIQNRNESEAAAKKQFYANELNSRLMVLLNYLGFDVSVVEKLQQNGIFNPLNAEKNVEGLTKIIEIAQEKRGIEAFPEEFSHLIIAGLKDSPLIRRALEFLTDEQIQTVLGEQYEQYKNEYNNNQQLLKEECLGKMLAESLQTKFKNDKLGFMQRVWNFIKSIFSKGDTSEINRIVNEAHRVTDELASNILSDDFYKLKIDNDAILSSKQMYQLDDTVNKLEEFVNKVQEKLYLLQNEKAKQTNTGVFTKEQSKVLRQIDSEIKEKQYIKGCYTFLNSALSDIKQYHDDLIKLSYVNLQEDPYAVRNLSMLIVNLRNHAATYNEIIQEMSALDMNYAELELPEQVGIEISQLASEVMHYTNSTLSRANSLTKTVLTEFLKPYWKDKKIDTKFIKNQVITIDTLLTQGFNDITWADSLVNALSESSDILLSLMAKISIHQQDLRDSIMIEDDRYIREAEQKLRNAGGDSKKLYELDENGKPTGWIISDRNSAKYEKNKKEYKESLKSDKQLSARKRLEKLQRWEYENTEEIEVKFNGEIYTVRVPKKELYSYPEGQSPLDKLTSAEREYYDKMLALKAARESVIPEYKRNLYRAVQIRTDFVEELSRSITNPKELLNKCIDKVKDQFVRRVDDTEFGQLANENEEIVMLNARGKNIKQIPIYYTSLLEDMSQLSMDFGGAMRAFSASMLNYGMMNEILPQMELLNDTLQNRKVKVQQGNKITKAFYKIFGKEFEQTLEKEGKELKLGQAGNFLMDKFFYGITKQDEKTVGNTNIDTAKLFDFIKSYTSVVGMGLNIFSGISNLTMGGVQTWIEAFGKENFGFKDLAKAHALYDKDILGCLAEMGSIKRENKLSLLMDKFDALESFYDNIKHKAFYKNGTLRAAKELNLMIFNEIGEHRLHNIGMLAILNNTKVKLNGKEISLYDALEVSKEELDENGNKVSTAAYLKLKDGVTKLDGTAFTEEDFIEIKRKVSRANRRMHGAYSDAYKGQVHQKALGRLAMQFRQWMPAFYSNRFAQTYYDVELGDIEEGFYVTAFKFATNIMKDMKDMKFEFATNWNNLTPHQRANMRRFILESALFGALCLALWLIGPIKDKESTWAERMAQYQLRRLRLEVGAGVPFHPDFMQNILTMIQSPAAAIKSCNNVIDLFKFWNIFNEIETGRYKGYSRYHKDFIEALPVYGQLRKAIDLKGEDYMFNIFNSY